MRAPWVAAASALAFGVLIGGAGCRPPSPSPPPATPPAGTAPAASPAPSAPAPTPAPSRWARETLSRLTLEQKVAQMIGVRAFGLYRHPSSKESRQLRRQVVQTLGVGSVVVFESEVESVPRVVNELQSWPTCRCWSRPTWSAASPSACGAASVPLPYAMAIGATRSEEAARFMGEVSAREGRALGIHWALAPVADVNSNPANPVINIRSFGEDPDLVGRMVAAFIRGAHEGGLLTTAKHFPGHGDTELDSHLQARLRGRRPRAPRHGGAAAVPAGDGGRRGLRDARPRRGAGPRSQRRARHAFAPRSPALLRGSWASRA